MNDLSGKEDTFNAHKTAHSLATFRIYACMITPWRQAPVSTALDMTRLVLSNLCRRKETVDCVRAPFMQLAAAFWKARTSAGCQVAPGLPHSFRAEETSRAPDLVPDSQARVPLCKKPQGIEGESRALNQLFQRQPRDLQSIPVAALT